LFATQDILVFSVMAGVLASAVLWATWQWSRSRRRFLLAGVTTWLGFMAWNFTLNATQAVPNFDVDAPIVRLSWADAGSGVFACLATGLVLGLITERNEPAYRVVGTAAIAGVVAIGLDLFVL
jgi:cation transporter-like permease